MTKQSLIAGVLFLTLWWCTACTLDTAQPTAAHDAMAPQPQSDEPVILWRGMVDAGCRQADIGLVGAVAGPCDGEMTGGDFVNAQRADEVAEIAATYAPFTAETPAGDIEFLGAGTTVATPAQERMIAEWARLVQMETVAGQTDAAWGVALMRHREGGIAGFCDDVTIYVTGDAYGTSCRSADPVALGRTRLDSTQLEVLYEWVDTFQPFEWEQSDPAVADAMTVRLDFFGRGEQSASPADQQAMLDFANELLIQVGAQASTPPPSATPSPDAPAAAPGTEPPGSATGAATVEGMTILILESFPVQVQAAIAGYLPDACTTIEEITVTQEGDTFRVEIATARPADAMCAQVITPFEEVVGLDVYGLPAGEYAVQANGVRETFTLAVDNVPPSQ